LQAVDISYTFTKKQKVMEKLKNSINGVLKNVAFILTIGSSLAIGFVIGYYYVKINQSYTGKKEVKTVNNTSVAINEHSQLIIIDKVTDNYQIYSDSVGMNVFKMYAKTLITK
jgi:hypothetical protein